MSWLARLTLVRTDEGGRSGPIGQTYRALVYLQGEHEGHDAFVRLVGREWLFPGETGEVLLDLFHPELLDHPVVEGREFEFREGATRAVARGEILNSVPASR
ncbi:MAG: hypothetical protein QOF51_2163 [Chloroflexota bacterium]|jgi:translation elongation factor EF-Tu-like GTPase|nr:hypothetical protein [Chloroflexota bacterium]